MGIVNSIFALKCPHCRQGKLFAQPFNLSNAFSMPSHCPHCNQNFYPEPGFYYGAMFIAYAISAWLFFVIGLVMAFGFGIEFNKILIVILIVAAISFIYFFRLARSIWIHIFVKYDPSLDKAPH
ncbi:MAG TPA: DUF983 domain-containing protein [Membranihabitans sp.]|nr:DUF983 domain-containing protein [Membranihabitans sp.]